MKRTPQEKASHRVSSILIARFHVILWMLISPHFDQVQELTFFLEAIPRGTPGFDPQFDSFFSFVLLPLQTVTIHHQFQTEPLLSQCYFEQ
jgi:hypothetical protein